MKLFSFKITPNFGVGDLLCSSSFEVADRLWSTIEGLAEILYRFISHISEKYASFLVSQSTIFL